MRKQFKKVLSAALATVMLAGSLFVSPVTTNAAPAFSSVGGWNETIYAQINGVSDSDVTGVSYSGPTSGSLTGEDLQYLVRDNNGGVRVDIPGLKAGTYSLTVTTKSGNITKSNITVNEQDRSGYAHFNNTEGVGAYNDDGTIKDNAIILYVTDTNKNSISLTYGGVTVTGIGNILNSVGEDVGGGLTAKGGKANSNAGILKLLAEDNVPLVVRFVGVVSNTGLYKSGTFTASSTPLINGLTIYDSLDNGGTEGDNGHMARMKNAKNVTLEGIGTDATIDGWGFHFMCTTGSPELGKNFEVRNLTFINTPEDAVGMEGTQGILNATTGEVTNASSASADILGSVERCWVHNCEFYCPSISGAAESDKSEGDGSVDFKRGQYFTCSYNYFEGCHKTNLVGSSDTSLQYNLTYHHNYWKNCEARGPLARRANIHMYNNVWEGQSGYAQNPRANSYIFSEYNLFYKCKNPQDVAGGALKSYNDCFASTIGSASGTVVSSRTQTVSNSCAFSYRGIDYSKFDTDSTQSYIPTGDYFIQEDIVEARKQIAAYCGVMNEVVKTPAQITMSDMSVLDALGATPTEITSFPFSAAPGKIGKQIYAFEVNTPITVTVDMSGAIMVNEAGVPVLAENGSVTLAAGAYAVQPTNFGNQTFTASDFKEMYLNSISIETADPNYDPNKLTAIALNKTSATLLVNGTTTLSVSYTPSSTTSDKTVTWTSSNNSVATVSNGIVTAKAIGTAVITAKVGDLTATCTVTVSQPVALTGITLNKTTATIEQNATEKLTVSLVPSNTTENVTVTWTSNNTSVATVKDGVVTGVGEGTAVITAKTGNFTATCTVTVNGITVPEGAYTHNFTTDGKTSQFYSITGNMAEKGTVTYSGLTLTQCLKIESSTSIKFDAPVAGKLVLVFGGSASASGKSIKIDGSGKTIGSDQILTIDLAAGSHTITKGDSIFLYFIDYQVEQGAPEAHKHSYSSSVTTAATCTTAGVMTYTCSCGDSYTEAIAATGHNYSSEWTIDKEATTTSAGEKSRHCTKCSARTDVTVIPMIEEAKNGLVYDSATGKWYYYVDNAVATSFTGLAQLNGVWWYVANGVLDATYTGTVVNGGSTWYVINGKLDSDYTGIRKNGSDFWYVVNGKVNTDFVGLYNYADYWWYITDGKIQTSYSGIVDYSGYKWFVSGGKVDTSYTGLRADNSGTFYCVQAGKVNLTYTGLVQSGGSWWYVVNGVLNTSTTGIVTASGSQWFVATGKLQSSYTGTQVYGGVTYTIVNGKVTATN